MIDFNCDEPAGASLSERWDAFAHSDHFKRLFADGMGLMEISADFLSGPGKAFAAALPRLENLAYSAESAKLTTRLMIAAAWLLVVRAVREGEMPAETLARSDHRIAIPEMLRKKSPAFGAGPEAEQFESLIARARSLLEQIRRCDDLLMAAPANSSPVAHQIRALKARLGALSASDAEGDVVFL